MTDEELLSDMRDRTYPRIRTFMLAVWATKRKNYGPGTPPLESFSRVPNPPNVDDDTLRIIEHTWYAPIRTCAIALLRAVAKCAVGGSFVATPDAVTTAKDDVDIDERLSPTTLSSEDSRYLLERVAESFLEAVAALGDIEVPIGRETIRLLAPP